MMPDEVADPPCDLVSAHLPFKFPVASDIACIPTRKTESENTRTFASCIFDKNELMRLTICHTFSE